MKKLITLFAIAGMVLALAPAAQAAIILSDGHTGDYRIIFVSNGSRDASSPTIGDYNTFVNTEASLLTSTAVKDIATTWAVVGSTAAMSARENTGTLLTDGGATDVPIYTSNGELVAINNAALWNAASVDLQHAIYDSTGNALAEETWTGTNTDGTRRGDTQDGTTFGNYDPLVPGNSRYVMVVRGNNVNGGWITAVSDGGSESKHFMALSGVISTGPAATPGTLIFGQ
jgi:hypothetical protein